MRARPSRAVSLLVTSVILTGFLAPGAAARPAGADPAPGPEAAVPVLPPAASAVVDLAAIPDEPPAQPARPGGGRLFGADCDTEIDGSTVTAYCQNGYPETDLLRLHVECDRWWDVDGDGAAVAVDPAGRVELTGRCWKEVRAAWVTHRRP
ncbi:hypothetical protein AB0P12_29965 [Streptomyces subrutilus]|uniref:Secreted protein n=1 Tax=Streptomyces subrutilus TaxID=36818 RepID=A0A5P2UQ17_9ACTN|nr:hypothetical protein [Streptomyces subrutilus]QEU81203.1 hypothetical protein CP968_25525 [Streptomyces subrutilus]WSJ29474.1 hypothetical protein OG479_09215 [Streptomyces subrutilus]GGZ79199.1 hypothetical protein GCM10010371_43470 [Streptomyces subrutilus]